MHKLLIWPYKLYTVFLSFKSEILLRSEFWNIFRAGMVDDLCCLIRTYWPLAQLSTGQWDVIEDSSHTSSLGIWFPLDTSFPGFKSQCPSALLSTFIGWLPLKWKLSHLHPKPLASPPPCFRRFFNLWPGLEEACLLRPHGHRLSLDRVGWTQDGWAWWVRDTSWVPETSHVQMCDLSLLPLWSSVQGCS